MRIEDGDLTLEKVRRDDRGKYECVATNIVTRVVTATQLIVECKTSFVLLFFLIILSRFWSKCMHYRYCKCLT